jgi:hypothetical protein
VWVGGSGFCVGGAEVLKKQIGNFSLLFVIFFGYLSLFFGCFSFDNELLNANIFFNFGWNLFNMVRL